MARNRNGHGSGPRLTSANLALIDAIVQGKAASAEEAAELCGLSKRSVYDALTRDHIKAEIERRSREKLRGFALPRALNVMGDLLNADSEYVRADIAKHIGAIHGVKPTADAAPGAAGGFVYRLVVNGQPIELGAFIAPSGANPVQTLEHEPQRGVLPEVQRVAHNPAEAVDRDEGAGGS